VNRDLERDERAGILLLCSVILYCGGGLPDFILTCLSEGRSCTCIIVTALDYRFAIVMLSR